MPKKTKVSQKTILISVGIIAVAIVVSAMILTGGTNLQTTTTTIPTTTTTILTTTTVLSKGKLSILSKVGNSLGDFYYVHAGTGYPEFIQEINPNEFDIYVKTLKEEPYRPVVTFIFRVENTGDLKVENIESTVICDEISPDPANWVITDSDTSHKGITLEKKWFNCADACNGKCGCDSYPEGDKVTYLVGCDEFCKSTHLGGYSIDRWIEFNVGNFDTSPNTMITLSCKIKIFAEEPSQPIESVLYLHFYQNR